MESQHHLVIIKIQKQKKINIILQRLKVMPLNLFIPIQENNQKPQK